MIGEMAEECDDLKRQIAWLKHQLFGRKTERFIDENHPLLFDISPTDPESDSEPSDDDASTDSPTKTPRKRTRGKRRNLADEDIPEEVCILEPEGIDPAEYKQIGEEVSYKLETDPGRIYKIKYIRPKYVSIDGEGPVIIADPPVSPLPKGVAGPGLCAMIVLNKFADHLPLYRQEQIFDRFGEYLPRSSMCRWIQQLAQLVWPLILLMKERVLMSYVVAGDETPVKHQKRSSKSYFWVFNGDLDNPYVIYDFRPNRGREGPIEWFSNQDGEALFNGYLVCDGYTGYDAMWQSPFNMTQVSCWAHVRRKFDEAKGNDRERAEYALRLIQSMYRIEREANELGLNAAARGQVRQARAKPLVDELFKWCDTECRRVLPKSAIGKAINYARNLETSLRCYLNDGRLPIDNNACERSLRGVAIGRGNWTFVGSDAGGDAAAVMFTLITNCRRNGANEWDYLADLFTRIPTTPISELEQFLPDVWQANRTGNAIHVAA